MHLSLGNTDEEDLAAMSETTVRRYGRLPEKTTCLATTKGSPFLLFPKFHKRWNAHCQEWKKTDALWSKEFRSILFLREKFTRENCRDLTEHHLKNHKCFIPHSFSSFLWGVELLVRLLSAQPGPLFTNGIVKTLNFHVKVCFNSLFHCSCLSPIRLKIFQF